MELHPLLLECAKTEFPLAGVVDIHLALAAPESIPKHIIAYDSWIGQNKMGAMEYLVRGRDRRADPRIVFPGAKSVLCVAAPYRRKALGAASPTQGPRYARYIDGPDYHTVMAEKLELVMTRFRDRCPEDICVDLRWKVCVDTSAVLERAWAATVGLGWIGKNSLLIHPQHGSYLLLAEALLTIETGKGPAPLPNFCGNCSRCLTACPTSAFDAPGVLDSRRCVSYWTLEKRGKLGLTLEQSRGIHSWVAGCDICQEVCPFNVKPTARDESTEPAGWPQTWSQHLDESEEGYRSRVCGSALNRVKPAQFSRNLAIALTNAIGAAADPSSRGELRALRPQIVRRLNEEADPVAREEWSRCLKALEVDHQVPPNLTP